VSSTDAFPINSHTRGTISKEGLAFLALTAKDLQGQPRLPQHAVTVPHQMDNGFLHPLY
jgi:hypothetical protein